MIAVNPQLSPVRPIHDVIPAAPTPSLYDYTKWSSKSYTGLAKGICIKLITGADGSTPSVVWIGFNKQPPGQFQVLDSFEYRLGFKTVEIYNNTNTAWTVDALVYDGNLRP